MPSPLATAALRRGLGRRLPATQRSPQWPRLRCRPSWPSLEARSPQSLSTPCLMSTVLFSERLHKGNCCTRSGPLGKGICGKTADSHGNHSRELAGILLRVGVPSAGQPVTTGDQGAWDRQSVGQNRLISPATAQPGNDRVFAPAVLPALNVVRVVLGNCFLVKCVYGGGLHFPMRSP